MAIEAQDRRMARASYARRSERVFLRIPIEIVGKDSQGKDFRERNFTLVINRHGARISAHRPLFPGQRIEITNLQSGLACPFRVIEEAGKTLGEGPEWGVECLEPSVEIWGITFPGRVGSPPATEHVDALVECSVCSSRELVQLTIEEYHTLATTEVVRRCCEKCGQRTPWRFGPAEADAEIVPGLSAGQGDRRRARRRTVRLPVRIRLQDGRTSVARTENLSRTGVCFVSEVAMEPGQVIRLTLGYWPGAPQPEEALAKIVWRRPMEGSNRFAYGVHLETGE